MRQQANAEDLQVCDGDAKVPHKVSGGERLDQATGTGVTPYAGLPIHRGALVIGKGDIESDDADQGALEHRHDVRVPASSLSLIGRIVRGSVLCGKPRRDDAMDEGVEQSGGNDFVGMLGQYSHMVFLREWSHPFLECGNGWYEEGVLHDCGCLSTIGDAGQR